ncbi:MAG: DUF1854 domain-containing protein [Planctomycetota bacterium]|nr:DUF1854 domain-containing protein [Planctomycetota bacterium]
MHTSNTTATGAECSEPSGTRRCLERDAWGRLVWVDEAGLRHVGVHAARAFPLSDAEGFISILDEGGLELAWIESVAELSESTRRILDEELRLRGFMPVITRIVRVSSDTPPADWEVETDRGPTRFRLESEDDVRRVGLRRVVISDALKMRYQVPDTRDLEAYGRRHLERYLY